MKRIVFLLVVFGMLGMMFVSRPALAATPKKISDADLTATAVSTSMKLPDDKQSNVQLDDIPSLIIKALLWLVGASAFVAVIYGGFQYMTAGGDASKAATARKTIMWAILGVMLASLSWLIINLVAKIK